MYLFGPDRGVCGRAEFIHANSFVDSLSMQIAFPQCEVINAEVATYICAVLAEVYVEKPNSSTHIHFLISRTFDISKAHVREWIMRVI